MNEYEKTIAKILTAINFWQSFRRSARWNHRTKEVIEITIASLSFVLEKLKNEEIDMKLIKREVK